MPKVSNCAIDENDEFKFNATEMSKWFNHAMDTIMEMHPNQDEVPFLLFLMGAEAALRCQNREIH
tara:strand:- start:21 stop:215 length:195 start_codon:yes stop_codon:yes gene_type:complete